MLATRRPPSRLAPWYGSERNFAYVAEVQPVLDKHCVSCHDYGKAAGEKLNLAGDLGLLFNTSYSELRRKKFVQVPGAGPFQVLQPKSWGSHASKLVEVLLNGHGDDAIDAEVQLDRESFDRIVTWIDINAPYYPEYASNFRDNLYGRSPLDDRQLAELKSLTGSTDVNFTRPDLSPCLARFTDRADPAYRQAMSIIAAGKQLLSEHPRADMPGFRLVSPIEIAQQAKYDALQQAEQQARQAAVRGEKRFDARQ
jgi:hypothetical protein